MSATHCKAALSSQVFRRYVLLLVDFYNHSLTAISLTPAGMIECMKTLTAVASGQELSEEERQCLSMAYKGATTPLRDTWRFLNASHIENHSALIDTFKRELKNDISALCGDIIVTLFNDLIPFSVSVAGRIHYYQMYVCSSHSN
jgi:hypothetical protein